METNFTTFAERGMKLCAARIFLECLMYFVICVILLVLSVKWWANRQNYTIVDAIVVDPRLVMTTTIMPEATATPLRIQARTKTYLLTYNYKDAQYTVPFETTTTHSHGQYVSIYVKNDDPTQYFLSNTALPDNVLKVLIGILTVGSMTTLICMINAYNNPNATCSSYLMYKAYNKLF